MKYFVPEFGGVPEVYRAAGWAYAGPAGDDPLPAQSALEDTIGGLPGGLPAGRWPLCNRCGTPQSLLAQLRHRRERFDLGREGRVLFVFLCNDAQGRCPTWEMDSGANSCFVVNEEELTAGFVTPPILPAFPEQRRARWLDEQVFEDLRVVRWLEKEDGVPASYPGSFGLNPDLPEGGDEQELEGYNSAVFQGTRLGGMPFWIQFPKPPAEGRFVGQIDSDCCSAFGGNGIGYIFLTGPASAPRGWFLWQRT